MFENVVGWGTMLCEQEVMIWGKSVQHEHHGGKMWQRIIVKQRRMVVFLHMTMNLNRTMKVNVMKNYVKSENYVNGKQIKYFINVLKYLIAHYTKIS